MGCRSSVHTPYILTRTMAVPVRTHRSVQEVLGTPEESQLYRQEDFPTVALNPNPT